MRFDVNVNASIHVHAADSHALECIGAKLHRIEMVGSEILGLVKEGQMSQAAIDQLAASLRGSTDNLSASVQQNSPTVKE